MSAVMGSGGRAVAPAPGVAACSTGTIYSPGNPLVTTMAGPSLGSQGTMRAQAPPAIAVRITTAPIPTAATSSSVS